MAVWQYEARDILTRELIAYLPLRGVRVGSSLTGAGELSGKVTLIGQSASTVATLWAATEPGRVALWARRDDVLLWGGPITYADDQGDGSLSVRAKEWRAWLARQFLTADLTYTNVDQLSIVRGLINWCQTGAGQPAQSNVGIVMPGGISGVARSQTYVGTDVNSIDKLISDMADDLDGFDWTIAAADDGYGVPYPAGRLGYPRLGRTLAQSGLMWIYDGGGNGAGGGTIAKIGWSRDWESIATRVHAVGGTPEGATSPIRATITAAGLDMYPSLGVTLSESEVITQAPLESLATAELSARSTAVVDPSLTVVDGDVDPVTGLATAPRLGSWSMGDEARIVAYNDPRWPNGLDTTVRIVAWETSPADIPDVSPAAASRQLRRSPEVVKVTCSTVLLPRVRRVVRERTTWGRAREVEKRLRRVEAFVRRRPPVPS